jgi:hypothetical protein
LLVFKGSHLPEDANEREEVNNMKVQVYTLNADQITWGTDGYLTLDADELASKGVTNKLALRRLNIFIGEHQDEPDKEALLEGLSSVFYVPFCRFGDIIEEDTKPIEKVDDDETEGISDEDTAEAEE